MRLLTPLTLLATFALATACSTTDADPGSAPEGSLDSGWRPLVATSGARLRARFITAGDARELVGFYDSERKEECTFQRAEDRRMRCLPRSVTYARTAGFSDAACQVPLGVAQQGATGTEAATYALSYNYDGSCGQTPSELRRVLDPASPRYTAGPGGCAAQPSTPTPPSSQTVLVLGDVVPWTDFVEAQETTSSGSLGETTLLAADGARQHLGFRIEQFNASCTFQEMADGKTRCVPAGRAGTVGYLDASCSKAAFVDVSRGGPCTQDDTKLWLHQAPSTTSCGELRAVYSLSDSSSASDGGDATQSYAERLSGGDWTTCTPTSTNARYADRRAIEADLTSSLPVAERIGGGSGRIVPALVAQPGTRELALGWHDKERDVDCAFQLASDGKMRCLPSGFAATLFFTDGACQAPSRVAVLGQRPCGAPAPRFAALASGTTPSTTRVFELGTAARDLTNVSTETAPGRCAKVAGVGRAFDATEVDPAMFVEGVALSE